MKKLLAKITALVLAVAVTVVFGACSLLETKHSFPNLISVTERESDPVRPIDSAPAAAFTPGQSDSVDTQLNELLDITAIQKKRPLFNSANIYLDVKDSYEEAVKVLNRYIKNNFTDVEKVLAIHDYLASKIEYDSDLYESYLADPSSVSADDPAFQLTGVFLNGKAVCDGIAKSFMLLCAIEGIDARYVRGRYSEGTGSVAHAWNKVKLDGEWYNVDVTLDSFTFWVEEKAVRVLNHGYFLRSDRSLLLEGGHEPSILGQLWDVPDATGEYDYYALHNFPGIKDCPMTAKNEAELAAIFKKVKNSSGPRVGAIEVKLDFFAGGEASKNLADYSDAIRAAYREVPNASFTYTLGMENPPFTRYPGGVFVFMIYM